MAKEKESSYLQVIDNFRWEMRNKMRALIESVKYCRDGFDEVGGNIKALRKEVEGGKN